MKKKIAIIGSGIGGLTLANLLKNNFEFVLYDKGDALNLEEGFGIQLSTNSITILNKIGFDQLNKNERYCPKKLDFYSINLKKICDIDLTIFNSESQKYTTLKRSILIKFLKENLLSNSIIFRKKIKNIEKIKDKINLYFEDGSNDEADYLVVSDGIFSNTKSIIEKKKIQPIYQGITAIRSLINPQHIANLDSNNISVAMGSNAHVVLYPINQSKEINLVCLIKNRIKKNEEAISILSNTIFKENKNLINLFKGDIKSWPIYSSIKPSKSIYKNVLYIGDAFYAFLPTLAQGASQAIESANEVFNLINENNPDIQNIYFKNREKRTNLINKRSKFNFFGFHISNPILKIFRNKVLKILVKNKKFINSYLGKVYK